MLFTQLGKTTLTRFLTALFLTLILADLYPHPRLAPGMLASLFNQAQVTKK